MQPPEKVQPPDKLQLPSKVQPPAMVQPLGKVQFSSKLLLSGKASPHKVQSLGKAKVRLLGKVWCCYRVRQSVVTWQGIIIRQGEAIRKVAVTRKSVVTGQGIVIRQGEAIRKGSATRHQSLRTVLTKHGKVQARQGGHQARSNYQARCSYQKRFNH